MRARDLRTNGVSALGISVAILALVLNAPAGAQDEQPILNEPSASPAISPADIANKDLKQATFEMVQGAYADAESSFRRVIAVQPDNVEAVAGLGMALGRQFKLDEADLEFDRVLALKPNHAVAHCGKAMVLLYRVERNELNGMTRQQALNIAGKECNKALDADTRVVEAHYLLGTVFKEEGRLDLAMQAFSGAIKLDPRYVRAFNMLAATQAQKGRLSEAIENYRQALSLQPRSISAHLGLADVYKKQSRWQDAVAELNKVLAINAKNIPAHLALAQAFQSRGDIPSALHEYEELKALKPDDALAYLEIARLTDRQGEMERSFGELQGAVAAMPRNKELRLRLAWQALTTGRPDESLKEYSNVLILDPANVEAICGLSQAYLAKSVRAGAPAIAATAEFQKSLQKIADESRKAPGNQALQLANGIMLGISGQPASVAEPAAGAELSLKLLYAEFLASQMQLSSAVVALATAINGTSSPEQSAVAADTAFMLKDLDSAESGYKRVGIFVGYQMRGQQGLLQVNTARNQAVADLNSGILSMGARQYKTAIEKFRGAVANNARLAAAQANLAEALEKDASNAENPLSAIKESVFRYQSYLALSPGLPQKEQERVQKRISKLEGALTHAQQNPNGGLKGLIERLSVR